MRITVTLDDELIADAMEFTGIEDKHALIRHALTSLVQRGAARGLIQLGGSSPELVAPRRRRWKEDGSGMENVIPGGPGERVPD
ncbi:type II toxin-antitoxin system VapB family antitoxin [Rhizobium sp. LjRoot254]|uniref:type II toxin-antitoxin system VapB family antitoxin n=1 Tax=Rhizobium sp. LjRoot254 TaxID=3342297 RepID=UPI003ECE56CF